MAASSALCSSKLDVLKALKYFGDLPQNVNLAIKAESARAFLNSDGIKYQMSPNLGKKLSPSDIGEIARPFTVRIDCYGKQANCQAGSAAATASSAAICV
jgi:hypothetical protein